MAHSLGNLVMWDALRLQRRINGAKNIVNNAISVEAAIWEEAFWPEQNVIYLHESDPQDNILYSPDVLMRHSWTFWFRQKNAKGKELTVKDVLSGQIYHSYVALDSALNMMKVNDMFGYSSHYNRNRWAHYPMLLR